MTPGTQSKIREALLYVINQHGPFSISVCREALALLDAESGKYIPADIHYRRVDELLEANNRLLNRAREAEKEFENLSCQIDEMNESV